MTGFVEKTVYLLLFQIMKKASIIKNGRKIKRAKAGKQNLKGILIDVLRVQRALMSLRRLCLIWVMRSREELN
ncbi:MAG: hypothetical protein GX660_09615 [Clostridiaceae bacterium]|nr:hypothetical protein [Clostridiaceae bacterium]